MTQALAYPTLQTDGWRFTDLAPLLQYEFHPVADTVDDSVVSAKVTLARIEKYLIPDVIRLVFVNGYYQENLSDLTLMNHGTSVSNLRSKNFKVDPGLRRDDSCWDSQPNLKSKNLEDMVPSTPHTCVREDDIFTALNTRFSAEVAQIKVTGNCDAEIHFLHIATTLDKPTASYPKCVVSLEKNSKATLIEDYVGMDIDNVYFSDAVTDITLEKDASLNHVMLQRVAKSAFHIGNCSVKLQQNSRYVATPIMLGARLSRYTLDVSLLGAGANVELNGLTLIDGRQVADVHTVVNHVSANAKSVQLQKCITDNAAQAVFNGKIIVATGASKTHAEQQSRNLILADKARINTQPQLEINNDDVICSHGATVSQIDPETLFFLKSRGIGDEPAKNLFIHAFATEIINKIPVDAVVKLLKRQIITTQ